jgi:hypothetical protein
MRLRTGLHASNGSRPNPMGTFVIFLGLGFWFLYYAWRGTVPKAWNPGEKLASGSRMRASTRALFWIGGALFTALGIVFYRFR